MTILELIQKTTPFFEKSGVPNPRLDVELLLAHSLKLRRMDLYVQFERVLTESELNQLRPMVKRRSAREPLQHIVGSVDFFNLTLAVSPQALIPRHETEVLIHEAIQLLGKESQARILDLGTGTGAIALSLLQALPGSTAVAVDLSEDALSLARLNAVSSKLDSRIEFRKGDLFDALQPRELFDLIISNPPYIPTAELVTLQEEVRFDPVLALDGGQDGLDIIRRIVGEANPLLKSGGYLMMEIGIGQMEAVKELVLNQGFPKIEFIKDLQQVERVVRIQKKPFTE